MTEKSEDQVIWLCPVCLRINLSKPLSNTHYFRDTLEHCVQSESKWQPYIPQSQYLALKKEAQAYADAIQHNIDKRFESESDLSVAVEALERIRWINENNDQGKIAQEALGKIGVK